MTNKEAIDILEHARLMSGFPAQIKFSFDAEGIEALEMAIRALEQQTCDDCISREAVLKIFDEACYIDGDWYVMREKIEKLPSVTQTRPKGKWKILDECANEGVYCSKCHKTVFKLEFSHTMKWRNFKYCPNCGAEMEVEK